jgi:hypothetical protein
VARPVGVHQGVGRVGDRHQFGDHPGDRADQVFVLLHCLLGEVVATIAGEVFWRGLVRAQSHDGVRFRAAAAGHWGDGAGGGV